MASELANAMDNPQDAEFQRWLDQADPPAHMAAMRKWRHAEGIESFAVVCHCSYARFVAERETAFAVMRIHNRTGEEP